MDKQTDKQTDTGDWTLYQCRWLYSQRGQWKVHYCAKSRLLYN